MLRGGLCGAYVIVHSVRVDFLSAVFAWEGVETRVYPAYAYFGFHVPMLVDRPCVAVCHSCARSPALIALVGEF